MKCEARIEMDVKKGCQNLFCLCYHAFSLDNLLWKVGEIEDKTAKRNSKRKTNLTLPGLHPAPTFKEYDYGNYS